MKEIISAEEKFTTGKLTIKDCKKLMTCFDNLQASLSLAIQEKQRELFFSFLNHGLFIKFVKTKVYQDKKQLLHQHKKEEELTPPPPLPQQKTYSFTKQNAISVLRYVNIPFYQAPKRDGKTHSWNDIEENSLIEYLFTYELDDTDKKLNIEFHDDSGNSVENLDELKKKLTFFLLPDSLKIAEAIVAALDKEKNESLDYSFTQSLHYCYCCLLFDD